MQEISGHKEGVSMKGWGHKHWTQGIRDTIVEGHKIFKLMSRIFYW
jgi:hypothetical protein